MNLQKYVKWIIVLMWLHLIDDSVSHDESQLKNRIYRAGKNGFFIYDDKKETYYSREIVEDEDEDDRRTGEKLTKSSLDESRVEDIYSPAGNLFLDKNSANSNVKKTSENESAYKLASNALKRLSALIIDNNNNNVSNGAKRRRTESVGMTVIHERSGGTKRKLLADVSDHSSDGDSTEKTNGKKETNKILTNSDVTEKTSLVDDGKELNNNSSSDGRINNTELGGYLGAPCESNCSGKLVHVFCHPRKRVCECEDKYPVQIGTERGCEKPKQLGDQCFYAQTCSFFDSNADCTQINHNAICQCKPGYHTVALRKGVKKMFCSEGTLGYAATHKNFLTTHNFELLIRSGSNYKSNNNNQERNLTFRPCLTDSPASPNSNVLLDVIVVSADLPTLLGVATGIAVLTGLLCFVLRLFSNNRYPAARHYGNANLSPPLLYSSDNQWINGIPLTVQGRSSSRASYQRSTTSLAQYPRSAGVHVSSSRAGAAREAAILLIPCHPTESRHSGSQVVPNTDTGEEAEAGENDVDRSCRSGSRRPSLTSVHSTTLSQKSLSYSARRFEQENQQKEQRAALKAAKQEAAARLASLPTPSPSSTENVLLIHGSANTEEDFLCSGATDSPAQSEPPALLLQKDNTETKPSISGANK